MSTDGQKGVDALKSRNYSEALNFLDRALASSTSPTWLLARSQANQQQQNYPDALRDAELAYHTAAERGSGNSRKQMIDAQYRRAVVLFKLQRFADADCCAKWSQLLCEGRPAREDDGVEKQVDEQGFYALTLAGVKADVSGQPRTGDGAVAQALSGSTVLAQDWNRAYVWRCQALGQMEKLPHDDPGRKVSVTKIPPRPVLESKKTSKLASPLVPAQPSPGTATGVNETLGPQKPLPEPGSVSDDEMKVRADFYQTNQTVTVSLFVQDVDKQSFKSTFRGRSVVLGPIPRDAAPYVKPGDRESYSTLELGGDIIPTSSRSIITPRKVELVLQKGVPGVKWATWGREVIGAHQEGIDAPSGEGTAKNSSHPEPSVESKSGQEDKESSKSTPGELHELGGNVGTAIEPARPATKDGDGALPAYPTSSKTGPKNWDKLADGEEVEDDDQKDVNFFFKQLYKNADPEQQRAMMKSFIESNGTALSTDWNDVKARTVETVPPDGVEAKKWD